jgi:hypothetical protein
LERTVVVVCDSFSAHIGGITRDGWRFCGRTDRASRTVASPDPKRLCIAPLPLPVRQPDSHPVLWASNARTSPHARKVIPSDERNRTLDNQSPCYELLGFQRFGCYTYGSVGIPHGFPGAILNLLTRASISWTQRNIPLPPARRQDRILCTESCQRTRLESRWSVRSPLRVPPVISFC